MKNSQSSIVNRQYRVVFFGSGPYVAPIIEVLNKTFNLTLVVTTETKPGDPVVSYCKSNNIKSLSVLSFSPEIVNSISSIVNVRIAVLASFGLIVPDEVLNIFEYGILNIHPSLLPKYRGATPGQAAILSGDTITGVSIIKLDEEVDHGPILAKIEEKNFPADTSETLYKRLFEKGARMLPDTMIRIIEAKGEFKGVLQDHSKATFTDRLIRENGKIDIDNSPSPKQLDRKIRAFYPWPTVWFKANLNGKERIIKLLPEQKIQVEGKNIMQLLDFENGYPEGHSILSKLSLF